MVFVILNARDREMALESKQHDTTKQLLFDLESSMLSQTRFQANEVDEGISSLMMDML